MATSVFLDEGSGDQISCNDRGFTYGDGLFETIRVSKGLSPLWDYHISRLNQGCDRLCIPIDLQQVEILARQYARELTTGIVKIIITRGTGGRGYSIPDTVVPTVCVKTFALPVYPGYAIPRGIQVCICKTRLGINPALAGIKHLCRLEQVLASMEWQNDESIDEGIMLDINNRFIEGSKSNLFIVRNDTLITPDLNGSGVSGVMRQYLLDKVAPEMQLKSRIANIKISDIKKADEVFLCNSVAGIWPVVKIFDEDRSELSSWSVGKLTRQLQNKIYSLWGENA